MLLPLPRIEQQVCDVTSRELGIPRQRVSPSSSLTEDLGCDSLDLIELIMTIEKTFSVTLPNNAPNAVYKVVFTRQPFRLSDLAELVYLQQGTGSPERSRWRKTIVSSQAVACMPFTQLGGRCQKETKGTLFERLESDGAIQQFRRRSDGMRCILIPSGSVEIGCDAADALLDERPKHVVEMDGFLMDAEPISTTAYCRFLNSIGQVPPEFLKDWFLLDPDDDRNEHMLLELEGSEWRPLFGTERWPMILVSWYGAHAYALWANGRGWKQYGDETIATESFLPTEAQWEYAARGARYQPFPWGDAPPTPGRMRYDQHRRRATYQADTLPMAAVNEQLGMSPFGLHHMAGNIWQWCRDWYADDFYQCAEARAVNPVNRTPTRVRSERGGSWIGSADLCRSSYRRGRPPAVRGRCLGFRCVSAAR
jgi:acyl carrier protein